LGSASFLGSRENGQPSFAYILREVSSSGVGMIVPLNVNSMREFAILPPEAVAVITRSRSKIKQLIAKNIEVERPKMDADSLAELVLTFFTGLSMEHNLSSSQSSIARKIDNLMDIVRTL
jgi:TetR/AcrR family transcriptional regulator, copper-responsive repressor